MTRPFIAFSDYSEHNFDRRTTPSEWSNESYVSFCTLCFPRTYRKGVGKFLLDFPYGLHQKMVVKTLQLISLTRHLVT